MRVRLKKGDCRVSTVTEKTGAELTVRSVLSWLWAVAERPTANAGSHD